MITNNNIFNHPANMVIAEPYLCVPAILETILLDINHNTLSQIELANYLGINVPKDYIGTIKNTTLTDNASDWGVILGTNSINNLFKAYNIPLKEEFISVFTFLEWNYPEIIYNNLHTGNYVICGYDYNSLNNIKQTKSFGHVSLILDITETKTTIYDPGPRDAGVKEVDNYTLYTSMKKKKDGLWIISHQ